MKQMLKLLNPWLRLIRVPNVLTVPGDPLAGFFLALVGSPQPVCAKRLFAAAGAAICLYLYGVILNDVVDVDTDAQERPNRPLPAGEITVSQARMVAMVLAFSGLNLALVAGRNALMVAAVLSGLILLYNTVFKRIVIIGVVTMGMCRGVSFLLGAVAARPEILTQPDHVSGLVLLAALGLTCYVIAFSVVARNEMSTYVQVGHARWWPFVVLIIFLPVVLAVTIAQQQPDTFMPIIYVFVMVLTIMRAVLLGGLMYHLQTVSKTVEGHIRNLLMLQACFCVAAGPRGYLPALFCVLMTLVFARLTQRFYSS